MASLVLPVPVEWVGGLRNKPWQNEEQAEQFFSWRLNVASCLGLLKTVRSCLSHYYDIGERTRRERQFVEEVASAWFGTPDCLNGSSVISAVEKLIRLHEYKRQQLIAEARSSRKSLDELPHSEVGSEFAVELFAPLNIGAAIASNYIEKPEQGRWMIIIDEAEFLTPGQHRILNSHMRAASGDVVFKITTMPYHHYTLLTNMSVELVPGEDFEYVYVDIDPIVDREVFDIETSSQQPGFSFAHAMFNKRAVISGSRYSGLTLDTLLGASKLLDRDSSDFSYSKATVKRLLAHSDHRTSQRIKKMAKQIEAETREGEKRQRIARFSDSIIRKMKPAVLLREAVSELEGARVLDIYSGTSAFIVCADGNPRRLLRLFNALLRSRAWARQTDGRIPPGTQNRVLESQSKAELDRIKPVGRVGMKAHDLIKSVGEAFCARLHQGPVSSDTYGVFLVDEATFRKWGDTIKTAVARGLLQPVGSGHGELLLPSKEGRFRLSYILSPHFQLLPRRGRTLNLVSLLPAQMTLELNK